MQHLGLVVGAFNGEEQLDALVEVAGHPVGAGKERLFLAAVQEPVDPRVFEEAVDHRHHFDRVTVPLHAGTQRADAAHVQADADPLARCGVQCFDDLIVDERVHLRHDLGRLPGLRTTPLAVDQAQEPFTQPSWRHRQLLQARRIGVAGESAEDRAGVLGNRLRRGEQAEVGVDASGALVVIARGQVRIAAQAVRGPLDHLADLRMHLVAADAVDDVRAGFFERARPADVPLFVEARGQFDHDGDLLVALGGAAQAGDDRGTRAGAVERLLDREDVGVVRRLCQERHDRVVRLVGMVEQDVALVHGGEQVGAVE